MPNRLPKSLLGADKRSIDAAPLQPQHKHAANEGFQTSSLDVSAFKTFVKTIPTAMAVYDEAMRLIAANDAYFVITGLPNDLLSKQISYADVVEQLARRKWYSDEPIETQIEDRLAFVRARVDQHLCLSTPLGTHLEIDLSFLPDGGFISMFRDVTEASDANEALRELAYRDPLTNLPNRRYFTRCLDRATSLAARLGSALAVALIDLDDFKAFNDTYGHPAGDELLIAFAEDLKSTVRDVDSVARLGGDEFAIVLDGLNTQEQASLALDRLSSTLSAKLAVRGMDVPISHSIGGAIYPKNGKSREALVAAADEALYQAKRAGKNQLILFEPAPLPAPACAAF